MLGIWLTAAVAVGLGVAYIWRPEWAWGRRAEHRPSRRQLALTRVLGLVALAVGIWVVQGQLR